MATVDEALQAAVARHQAGQLAEAEQIYRQILAWPRTMPMLDICWESFCISRDEVNQGIEYIRQAIALNPGCEGYHLNLGGVYLDSGQVDEAIRCFRQALQQKADFAPAYYNLASACG